MVARGWTEEQKRAYVLADNKLTELAGWDDELLAAELADLADADFDLGLTGFTDAELDRLLAGEGEGGGREGEDDIPEAPAIATSHPGDLWILGRHRLLCGDATVAPDVERVLAGVAPQLMVTDPPYGVEYDPAWRNKAGHS
jgi:ParB-like chromosome segregation protein Spo0J